MKTIEQLVRSTRTAVLLAGVAVLAGCGKPAGKPAGDAPATPRVPTNAHEMAVQRDTDVVYRERLIALGKDRNKKAQELNTIRGEMARIEKAVTNAPAASYQDDPVWLKLKADADRAQKELDEAQSNVQKAIGERMKAQYATMRASGATGADARPVMLPRPNPADYKTNALVNARELLNQPQKIVPAHPGLPRAPAPAVPAAGAQDTKPDTKTE